MVSKKRRRSSRKRDAELLERMITSDAPPRELAETMGMRVMDLIDWAARPENATRLAALVRLTDMHTQMLISRYRTHAALQLAQLAAHEDGGELARKACVDLLKAQVSPVDADDSAASRDRGCNRHGSAAEPPRAPDAKAILEALEQIGLDPDEAANDA